MQAVAATSTVTEDDREYREFLKRMYSRFAETTDAGKRPLFTTNAEGLFEAYVSAFPAENQQYHTCNCCRDFVERYGGLVTINEDGTTQSAIWNADDAPEYYRAGVAAMIKILKRATVTGVFYSDESPWGTPSSAKNEKHGGVGSWDHLHVVPWAMMVRRTASVVGTISTWCPGP